MAEMTVPLVALPGGLWGSPNAAWDHLIKRESSGRPHVIQEIRDVNSGGNEAEGLFQITPKTWDRHGGKDFAPSARHATPQQQAIVAARIIQRNPSGSDWGAGRPGRESGAALVAGLVPVGAPAAPAPAPRPVEPYGMPRGSNSGGYGNNGVRFPDWVYQLGNAFGLKPSTYPGHQESNRNEAGYAPNPQGLNRGIDWAAPGAPDEVDRMQRFADYLASIPGELEQVIWQNPRTMRSVEVAGGRHQPGYFAADLAGHRNHVHTRQSHSLPIPGAAPAPLKPAFTELNFLTGGGRSNRTRPPINWLLHTEEGNSSAEQLARYCDGSHDVSYHYTIRDGIVCNVVDTDYASWSVLAANAYTINLCFAGSKAGWSREEWLRRSRDIDIAAYIAVQDCRQYGIPLTVIAPPYGGARPGISDHKYVTQVLKIGNHTDVGNNFPWDVFATAVNKYANPQAGDDELSAEAERMIRELYDEYQSRRRAPSRSFFAKDQQWGETPLGFLWNVDGNVNELYMTWGYLLGVSSIERDVEFIAANGVAPASWAGSIQDEAGKKWLSEVGQQWCQGLIGLRAAMQKAFRGQPAQAVQAIQSAAVEPQVVYRDNPTDAALQAENARLREQIAQLQETRNVPATVEPLKPGSSTGEIVGHLINSVEDWTEVALAMDTKQRAALGASLKVLEMPKGGDK